MLCGEKILTLRKKYGYTQEALAEKLSISHQAVSRWESGQALPDVDKLVSLSRLFGVSVDYLLDDQQPVSGKLPPDAEPCTPPEQEAGSAAKRHTGKLSTVLLCIGIALLLLLIALSHLIPSTVMKEQSVTGDVIEETILKNGQTVTEVSEDRYVYTQKQTYGLLPFLSCHRLWPLFLLCCIAVAGSALWEIKRRQLEKL